MSTKRFLYGTALAVTGLGALGIKVWVFFTQGTPPAIPGPWGWGHGHPFPPFAFGLPLLVLLAVAAFVWYGRKSPPGSWINPWEVLGVAYVEGRMTREEFQARRAVMEETPWK